MKRTTIFIPEELERDLQVYARRRGKATASVVREAIAAYIVDGEAVRGLPSFAGAFDSGHTDTADRHDELIFRTLPPHGEVPSAARRPARRTPRAAGRPRKRR